MAFQFNPFTGTFDIVGAGGSGAAIGDAVGSGINNTVLYIDGSGNLACSSNFTYDGATLGVSIANGVTNTPGLIITNSDIVNVGNLNSIRFKQNDFLSSLLDFGEIRLECTNDGLGVEAANYRFYAIAVGTLTEIFRTWSVSSETALEAVNRFSVNLGSLPSYRVQVVEDDPMALAGVVLQGYSDGGLATKSVLEIRNEGGEKMVTLAGSSLGVGSGDYGGMNFFGTASTFFDGYSFGDFNWINNSGEASGDLRMGTFRVYRNGSAYQGSYQLVLRNGSGAFTVPFNARYDSLVNIGNNSASYEGQLTVEPNGAAIKSIVSKGAAAQSANLFEAQNSSATALWSIKSTGAVSFDANTAPAAANQLSRSSSALQFHDGTAARNLINKVRKNSTGTIFSRPQINLIEGSNVTLTVADDAGNDEIDVTIASSGGGAGATWTEVEIDFGATPQWSKTFTIIDAGSDAGFSIVCVPSGREATGRVGNDQEWDNILLAANPTAGSFELSAIAVPGPIVGKRNILYSIIT